MTVNLKQNADGSMGMQGTDLDDGGFLTVNIEYLATSVDKVCFVAPRKMIVKKIVGRPTVAGTDAGAVTAVIKKAASGTAITSSAILLMRVSPSVITAITLPLRALISWILLTIFS